MMVSPPLKSPDPPIPATARPMTKAVEDGATAHTREPISKIKTKMKKMIWKFDSQLVFEVSRELCRVTCLCIIELVYLSNDGGAGTSNEYKSGLGISLQRKNLHSNKVCTPVPTNVSNSVEVRGHHWNSLELLSAHDNELSINNRLTVTIILTSKLYRNPTRVTDKISNEACFPTKNSCFVSSGISWLILLLESGLEPASDLPPGVS